MKKMKIPFLIALFLVSILNAKSQVTELPKNSVYLEIFGSAVLYSVNYERKLSPKFYGRIGFSTFAESDILGDGMGSGNRITTFPVLITFLPGTGKSHFEVAGGMLLGLETEPDASNKIIDLTGFIGYRYQPQGKGFVFRAGLTPLLSLDNEADYPDPGIMLLGGISFGYHF
jgi:hypothetical protein